MGMGNFLVPIINSDEPAVNRKAKWRKGTLSGKKRETVGKGDYSGQ